MLFRRQNYDNQITCPYINCFRTPCENTCIPLLPIIASHEVVAHGYADVVLGHYDVTSACIGHMHAPIFSSWGHCLD